MVVKVFQTFPLIYLRKSILESINTKQWIIRAEKNKYFSQTEDITLVEWMGTSGKREQENQGIRICGIYYAIGFNPIIRYLSISSLFSAYFRLRLGTMHQVSNLAHLCWNQACF